MQIFKKKKEGEGEGTGGYHQDSALPDPVKDKKKKKSKDKDKDGDDPVTEGEPTKQQSWDRFEMSRPTDFQVTTTYVTA